MMERGHAAFHLLLGVSLQQDRRIAVADTQHHGIVVDGLAADEPVAWREKHLNSGASEIEFVSLPMAHDSHVEGLRRGDHVLQGLTWWQHAYP